MTGLPSSDRGTPSPPLVVFEPTFPNALAPDPGAAQLDNGSALSGGAKAGIAIGVLFGAPCDVNMSRCLYHQINSRVMPISNELMHEHCN